jgi:hypothetical protein|tara:strand:- start:560 stop:928 length:369 start_codon:yes stop_codon:yes gene_type:complete
MKSSYYPIIHKELSNKLKPINEFVIEIHKEWNEFRKVFDGNYIVNHNNKNEVKYWVVSIHRIDRDGKAYSIDDEYYYYDLEKNLKLDKVSEEDFNEYYDYKLFEGELCKVDDNINLHHNPNI